jgi:hypothetical protein
MFPPNSLELKLAGNYAEIRVMPVFIGNYRKVPGLTVSDSGVISFRVGALGSLVAHNTVHLPAWYPDEVQSTGMTNERAAWRKRDTVRWDGRNPIVKALRELRRSRVGGTRGKHHQRMEKNKPQIKHKWK